MTLSQTEIGWLIRDVRGVPGNVKLLLHTINSRGEAGCSTAWKTTAADMGCGKDAFYAARKWASEREVIRAIQRREDTTLYFVNVPILQAYLPEDHSGNPEAKGVLETRNGRVNLSTSLIITPSLISTEASGFPESKVEAVEEEAEAKCRCLGCTSGSDCIWTLAQAT
ncbi:hypothetical protein [Nocardioides sp.]|uniref:hypothetical protein n=1 Tax=Nocardioides sp. TaxID=35761 RepID=UPI002C26FE7F|nr:hypothetical protein [Nocardioides sp.]HSX68456.1 hypothetical protein [Nocardioides sp.]